MTLYVIEDDLAEDWPAVFDATLDVTVALILRFCVIDESHHLWPSEPLLRVRRRE